MSNPSYLRKGNDESVAQLITEMNDGKIDAIITYNTTKLYISNADDFNKGLSKVKFNEVSTSLFMDETASKMDYICPDNHNLESWGDANPSNGEYILLITYN